MQTGHIQAYLYGALGGAIAFVIIQVRDPVTDMDPPPSQALDRIMFLPLLGAAAVLGGPRAALGRAPSPRTAAGSGLALVIPLSPPA